MISFKRTPQFRNARAFLPLNLSAVGSVLELTILIYKLCLRGSARGVKTVVTVGIAVELLVLAVAICRLA